MLRRGMAEHLSPLAGTNRRPTPNRADVTVSREHAVVIHEDALFSVEDLGSLNGTFVNRARIDKEILENGDELQIGKYRLTFVRR